MSINTYIIISQPLTGEDFETLWQEDPVKAIKDNPSEAFNKHYFDTWDQITNDPNILKDNLNVFREAIKNPSELSRRLNNEKFADVFINALINNPSNVDALNSDFNALQTVFKNQYDISVEHGSKINSFNQDGTITTQGINSVNFNPKRFPGSKILSNGELLLGFSKLSSPTINGGILTKTSDNSNLLTVTGGNVIIPLLYDDMKFKINDGNIKFGDFTYIAGDGGFLFQNPNIFDPILEGNFFRIGSDIFVDEFQGKIEFERNKDVNFLPNGGDTTYTRLENNNPLFRMTCSVDSCTSQSSPLALPQDTKFSFNDFVLTQDNTNFIENVGDNLDLRGGPEKFRGEPGEVSKTTVIGGNPALVFPILIAAGLGIPNKILSFILNFGNGQPSDIPTDGREGGK